MEYSLAACAALALVSSVAARAGDGLAECRSIAADSARLACYDALVDRPANAGETAPGQPLAAPAAVAATAAAPVAAPLPSPEELFGRDVVQSDAMVRQASGAGQPLAEITATVTELLLPPYGKLVLALDNGQVWSQVDSSRLDLRTGDEVRIRRASLGSYLLATTGSKKTIRVRRSK